MKALRRFSGLFLTLILVLGLIPNAYALTVTEEMSESDSALTSIDVTKITGDTEPVQIDLYTSNPRLNHDADGTYVTVDLLEFSEETDANDNSRLISWQIVGVAQFRLRPMPGNGMAAADWSVTLITSERIKYVSGFFTLLRDDLGPFNHEYDEVLVNYRADQLYSNASGSTALSMYNTTTNKNIIFQWSGWEVTTVTKVYNIRNGEVQGNINDFE